MLYCPRARKLTAGLFRAVICKRSTVITSPTTHAQVEAAVLSDRYIADRFLPDKVCGGRGGGGGRSMRVWYLEPEDFSLPRTYPPPCRPLIWWTRLRRSSRWRSRASQRRWT